MLHHKLPESLLPTLTLTSADDNHIKSQYPLRTTLLHFMIPLNGWMDHDHLITLNNRYTLLDYMWNISYFILDPVYH